VLRGLLLEHPNARPNTAEKKGTLTSDNALAREVWEGEDLGESGKLMFKIIA
jgi:hypothetical protein